MIESDDSERNHVRILDPSVDEDAEFLARLRTDTRIEHVDSWATQDAALKRLGPTLDAELVAETPRFVYYPWRRAVVKILGPLSFRRLRLDRNRNLITGDEQNLLGRLTIGVVGLSSGHVIAHTLAMQGMVGELRLADFDDLELSNLNRIPAGLFDLSVNKTIVAARRIAELDPYLTVRTMPAGISRDDIDDFLDGLDIVVEECDSLDVKALVRHQARARRLPVVMATSDRGMVDVERFDLEPDRPIFHGLLGDLDPAELAGLSGPEKVPYVMRLIDVGGLTTRGAASLLEVGHTLSTWPQLAGDVTLGAGAVAEAVRRIGLCEPLSSGRVSLDAGAALDRIEAPAPEVARDDWETAPADAPPDGLVGTILGAAARAPSGGNVQPWSFESAGDVVTIALAPEHTSTIDVALRGSAVAVGAAVYNARVAAAANDVGVEVTYTESHPGSPLRANLLLAKGADASLAGRYDAVLRRETNRHHGSGAALPDGFGERMADAAHREGARLRMITAREDLDAVAEIFAAADRIRYLTPRLHAEMASELRWPGDPDPDAGIDVRSLELGPGGDLALEILRRPEVMAELAVWDAGRILGADAMARVKSSSALAVICVDGRTLTEYARGGAAAEAVWLAAQDCGLAVAPMSPSFLYATNEEELHDVAPKHVTELGALRLRFLDIAGVGVGSAEQGDESPVLILRLAFAPATTVRSRRRTVIFDVPPLP